MALSIDPPILEITSIVLWSMLAMFVGSNLFWVYEVSLVWRTYEPPPLVHGAEAVQVRILTIDAEAVVQRTVDELPHDLTDRHVIAETPLSIDGAEVHVVPDSFECDAVRKGRALEWARQNLVCEKEFVLFLDEDTIVSEFHGLPDSDIVQFREEPQRTDSIIPYISEIYRMGFQIEQLAFGQFDYPLYTWGGGLAIRKSVEDRITWNTATVIEDTKFVWRAVSDGDIDFSVVPTRFENQAPPSLRSMISQRRRWIAGSREEHGILPLDYMLLYGLRDISWGLSPLAPVLFLLPFLIDGIVVYQSQFKALAGLLFGLVFVWAVIGIRYHGTPLPESILLLLLSPVIVIPHAAGALVGLISAPSTFEVTTKVQPEELAARRERTSQRPSFPVMDEPGTGLVLGSELGPDTILEVIGETDPDSPSGLVVSLAKEDRTSFPNQLESIVNRRLRIDLLPVGQSAGAATSVNDDIRVTREVRNPDDPVYLVFLIDHYLEVAPSGKRAVIWFDSLDILLGSRELPEVVDFVSTVTRLAHRFGANVYFPLDAANVEDQTVYALRRVCDTVISTDAGRSLELAILDGSNRDTPAYGGFDSSATTT